RMAIFRRRQAFASELTAPVVLRPSGAPAVPYKPDWSPAVPRRPLIPDPDPNEPRQPARPHPWLRWISIAAVIATYLLIVVGGVVRTTGSGLGCPDWPLCYGQPVPPAQTTSVIEYSHRAFGGVASVLIVATMLLWSRARAWDRRVVGVGAGIGVLLAPQLVLGAGSVRIELAAMD